MPHLMECSSLSLIKVQSKIFHNKPYYSKIIYSKIILIYYIIMFELKLDTKLDFYVLFLIIIKCIFVLAALGHVVLSHTNTSFDKYDAKLLYWKERTEFIFIVSMSILLIYYFHPIMKSDPMSGETKLLFFLFGWILLITAKWKLFITEAPWFQKISKAFN
jgi:hypothetical protein